MKLLSRLLMVTGLLAWCTCVNADLVIKVGDGDNQTTSIVENQGTVGVVIPFEILATNDSALNDSFSLESYNFAIDFLGDGFVSQGTGSMSNFSNFAVVPGAYNNDGTVTFTDGNAQQIFDNTGGLVTVNYDFIVGDANATDPLIPEGTGPIGSDGTPVGLFALTFDVGAAAAPGIYDVLVVANPTAGSGQVTEFTTDPGGQTIEIRQGAFEITAVPEPSSIVALGGLCFAYGWRKRRRNDHGFREGELPG